MSLPLKTTASTAKGNRWTPKVAGIIAFLIAYLVVRSIISSNSLETLLTDASNEINKHTPINIDSITQLTSTSSSGKELDYYYKITSSTTFTQSDLNNSLKGSLVKSDCSTDDTRKILNMGAILVYNYYDNQGAYIGKLSVNSSNCN